MEDAVLDESLTEDAGPLPSPEGMWGRMELRFAFISGPPPAHGPFPRSTWVLSDSVVQEQQAEGGGTGWATEVCRRKSASTWLRGR